MPSGINPDRFKELVKKNYDFLIQEFEFLIAKEDDWIYAFESSTTRVIIILERAINLALWEFPW
jgi:hypothetical protein